MEDKIKIEPTAVYLVVPEDYICLYNKLLVLLADFGLDLIRDCQASCSAKNRNIIDCWNMFQSACACHALSKDNAEMQKKADVYIKYIEAQLQDVYKTIDAEPFCKMIAQPITEDGRLYAYAGCGSTGNVEFYVKNEDYHLYQEYFNDGKVKKAHINDDGHLIINQTCDGN